ncbi:hypothetical protein OEZ86_007800 [Tetradesmus obliquus]|nr:hypothetical protein OEZ86_007800 [Tetradesmus obliquus]
MAMFARISGSLDLVVDDGYSAVPPNSWMWTEQSVAASRRRLGCAPFQHPSSSSKGSSQAQQDHRGALLVCRAGRRQQQRQGQGSVKRTAMRRSTPGHFLRHASGSSSSSSFLQAQYPQPQQQQQQQQRQPPAYSVLEKYDPLLCTLALYRDYLQPAH